LDDQLLRRIQLRPFPAKDGEARLVSSNSAQIVNGGFEDYSGNKLKGFDFHDQPGEISFVDTQVRHSGKETRKENRC
jgi:hypothetical protein